MKKRGILKLAVVVLLASFSIAANAQNGLGLRAYGVWSRGGLEFDPDRPDYDYLLGISADGSSWKNIQPHDSLSYNWESIQASFDYAAEKGQFLYLGINFGPDAPDWIYEHGVPKVFTSEEGEKSHDKWPWYPYYPDEDYKRYYKNFLVELGAFLKSQPKEKLEKLLFIQVKTGCTGDEAAYKGTTLNPDFELPKNGKEWSAFRLYAFNIYHEVFDNDDLKIPLLFNAVEPENFPVEWNWLTSEIGEGFGIKQGAWVRGHHLTGESASSEEWTPYLVNPGGLALFSRSEMDQTWTRPLYQINPELGFYWGMLNGLNWGLAVWDLSASALSFAGSNLSVQSSLRFFNKYADQVYPETSTRAFIALHEGLEASDTVKFPEWKYGEANKNNQSRYNAICNDPVYASRGARMDDPGAATKGQVYQRRSQKGYNDAGWEIWPTNYSRFITQIDPENTSIGLFRINGPITSDSPIYARFGRSFENSSGRNAMYFQLHQDFSGRAEAALLIHIIYFDQIKGSEWEFQYASATGKMNTAKTIICQGDKKWKHVIIHIEDVPMSQLGPMGSDFALVNTDDKDDIFHLIEVELSK